MNFRDTPEETEFRATVRAFLQTQLSPELKRRSLPGAIFGGGSGFESSRHEAMDDWLRKLAARRWNVPAWPQEYGGAGLSVVEQFILNEEMAIARAPRGMGGMGVGWVGPTLISHGTDQQRSRHLPGIASGEVVWCQGFSEPGAGSDLASVQTRAVRNGDSYVVNGHKAWTSLAHLAHWMILLARTHTDAPKHRGISCLLVDMNTPGITIRPILNLVGHHDFNEVFLDNVEVPVTNLVGEENQGWYVGASTLDFERSNISTSVSLITAVTELRRGAAERGWTLTDRVRHALVDREIESQIARLMSYQIISVQKRGGIPSREASIVKLFTSELDIRIWNTAMQMLGMDAQLLRMPERDVAFDGFVPRNYMYATASTVGGGTSEIQRGVIASRGLGLSKAW
jgi:alkylation response protein AidB-like acyl-CoA dehydrogenase